MIIASTWSTSREIDRSIAFILWFCVRENFDFVEQKFACRSNDWAITWMHSSINDFERHEWNYVQLFFEWNRFVNSITKWQKISLLKNATSSSKFDTFYQSNHVSFFAIDLYSISFVCIEFDFSFNSHCLSTCWCNEFSCCTHDDWIFLASRCDCFESCIDRSIDERISSYSIFFSWRKREWHRNFEKSFKWSWNWNELFW